MASKETIEKVWEKGDTIRGKDPDVWRRDAEGNKIRHGSYGAGGPVCAVLFGASLGIAA